MKKLLILLFTLLISLPHYLYAANVYEQATGGKCSTSSCYQKYCLTNICYSGSSSSESCYDAESEAYDAYRDAKRAYNSSDLE